ncbi:MAG: Fic family protein [Bryobacteraceae bacterium]
MVVRSQPEIGGIYSTLPRRIAGSPVVFPNAAKIPQLMKEYGEQLGDAQPVPAASFEAHFRLAAIHPFSDGNGRAASADEPPVAPWRLPDRCRAPGRSKDLSRHA